MISMEGNPILNSGEVVDSEAGGSDPPLSSNLCYTNGYYLPFGVVLSLNMPSRSKCVIITMRAWPKHWVPNEII
jgi:hypothetical protein